MIEHDDKLNNVYPDRVKQKTNENQIFGKGRIMVSSTVQKVSLNTSVSK